MKTGNIRKLAGVAFVLAGVLVVASYVSNRREKADHLDEDNGYIKSGSKTTIAPKETIYTKAGKRALDVVLSGMGIVTLLPLFAVISVAIYIDDPGPVIFKQKRVGRNCKFFYCHKFRSMKMFTPHDVPTHQLTDPERYITRVGRVLRRTSLDELPQIWDILRGRMSVVGPRPALWNQDDLVAERARYGANDVMPGLTGLAQISGRDELEIPDKAVIDGEYVEKQGFLMDARCVLRTIASVGRHDGVVEGGTGNMKNEGGHK